MASNKPRLPSKLAGMSAFTAPSNVEVAMEAVDEGRGAPVPETSTDAKSPAGGKDAKQAGAKFPTKTSFYQKPDAGQRMRSTFVHTMLAEGTASLSDFIAGAVQKEVERLEAQYNDGKPWPPVKPKQVPKGPPRNWTT